MLHLPMLKLSTVNPQVQHVSDPDSVSEFRSTTYKKTTIFQTDIALDEDGRTNSGLWWVLFWTKHNSASVGW